MTRIYVPIPKDASDEQAARSVVAAAMRPVAKHPGTLTAETHDTGTGQDVHGGGSDARNRGVRRSTMEELAEQIRQESEDMDRLATEPAPELDLSGEGPWTSLVDRQRLAPAIVEAVEIGEKHWDRTEEEWLDDAMNHWVGGANHDQLRKAINEVLDGTAETERNMMAAEFRYRNMARALIRAYRRDAVPVDYPLYRMTGGLVWPDVQPGDTGTIRLRGFTPVQSETLQFGSYYRAEDEAKGKGAVNGLGFNKVMLEIPGGTSRTLSVAALDPRSSLAQKEKEHLVAGNFRVTRVRIVKHFIDGDTKKSSPVKIVTLEQIGDVLKRQPFAKHPGPDSEEIHGTGTDQSVHGRSSGTGGGATAPHADLIATVQAQLEEIRGLAAEANYVLQTLGKDLGDYGRYGILTTRLLRNTDASLGDMIEALGSGYGVPAEHLDRIPADQFRSVDKDLRLLSQVRIPHWKEKVERWLAVPEADLDSVDALERFRYMKQEDRVLREVLGDVTGTLRTAGSAIRAELEAAERSAEREAKFTPEGFDAEVKRWMDNRRPHDPPTVSPATERLLAATRTDQGYGDANVIPRYLFNPLTDFGEPTSTAARFLQETGLAAAVDRAANEVYAMLSRHWVAAGRAGGGYGVPLDQMDNDAIRAADEALTKEWLGVRRTQVDPIVKAAKEWVARWDLETEERVLAAGAAVDAAAEAAAAQIYDGSSRDRKTLEEERTRLVREGNEAYEEYREAQEVATQLERYMTRRPDRYGKVRPEIESFTLTRFGEVQRTVLDGMAQGKGFTPSWSWDGTTLTVNNWQETSSDIMEAAYGYWTYGSPEEKASERIRDRVRARAKELAPGDLLGDWQQIGEHGVVDKVVLDDDRSVNIVEMRSTGEPAVGGGTIGEWLDQARAAGKTVGNLIDIYAEAKETAARANARSTEMRNRVSELYQEIKGAGKSYAFRDALLAELAKVREMGGEIQIKAARRSTGYRLVEGAAQVYPAEWIEASNAWGKVTIAHRSDSRGHYSGGGEIHTSGRDEEYSSSVAIHELGHHFEWTIPQLGRLQRRFYKRRTSGPNGAYEPLQRLSKVTGNDRYGADEYTRPDRFTDPYMGKEYHHLTSGRTTYHEMLTMGMEYLLGTYRGKRGGTTHPSGWDDEEMRRFIIGLIAGVKP